MVQSSDYVIIKQLSCHCPNLFVLVRVSQRSVSGLSQDVEDAALCDTAMQSVVRALPTLRAALEQQGQLQDQLEALGCLLVNNARSKAEFAAVNTHTAADVAAARSGTSVPAATPKSPAPKPEVPAHCVSTACVCVT